MDIVTRIERLFLDHGRTVVSCGGHPEPVSVLEHSLQCAQLAEREGLDAPLLAAALLHDIGHLLAAAQDPAAAGGDDHDIAGGTFLEEPFGPRVAQPVRLHVQARRYLATIDPLYPLSLSAASMETLHARGGCLERQELEHFESLPFALDAIEICRVDDAAKVRGRTTSPLVRYLTLLDDLLQSTRPPVRPPDPMYFELNVAQADAPFRPGSV